MGPTATWEYVGRISPAIPTLQNLVDHMEDTVNSYRRYKKHTVMSTEDDVAKLMVIFRESVLYRHIDGRKVGAREKFADVWANGFKTVSKGESLTRWFESRSELQPMRDDSVAEDYDDLTLLELEMEFGDESEHMINLHSHIWESASNDAPKR